MKKYFLLFFLFLACVLSGVINSCKKDATPNPTNVGTRTSFTEEFEDVYSLYTKGWVIKDYSSSNISADWIQGIQGYDKAGIWYGFSAFSFSYSQDEYAYSSITSSGNSSYTISSWLITPILSVKNGDKISFYTRADTTANYNERMQVLMNKSSSDITGNAAGSVGGFTTILIEINKSQASGAYPLSWTKYEYTFTGINGNMDTRIAFRHFVNNTNNAKGIGIDLFKFEVK